MPSPSDDSASAPSTPITLTWEVEEGRSDPDGDGGRRSGRRRWIARIGWGAIAAGVVVLLVGAFYWWKDDYLVSRSQDRLAAEFSNRVDQVSAGTSPEAFAAPAGRQDEEEPEAEVDVGEDGDDPRFAAPAPPTTEPPPETEEEPRGPGLFREFPPSEGDPLGTIRIPKIDLDWVVVEGVDLEELAQGPGHMPWTVVPGQPGNAGISGHRTTRGAPFHDLDELEPGDPIEVTTLTGTHTYEVVGTVIVSPTGVWVTQQFEGAWLTLTTCHPKGSARQRLVVFGRLVDGPNLDVVEAQYSGPYELPEPPEEEE